MTCWDWLAVSLALTFTTGQDSASEGEVPAATSILRNLVGNIPSRGTVKFLHSGAIRGQAGLLPNSSQAHWCTLRVDPRSRILSLSIVFFESPKSKAVPYVHSLFPLDEVHVGLDWLDEHE
jgi:hypothetical protein